MFRTLLILSCDTYVFKAPDDFACRQKIARQRPDSTMEVDQAEGIDKVPGQSSDAQAEETSDDTPALFVTTMPRDIWANPSLGALAALIDETEDDKHSAEQGVCP